MGSDPKIIHHTILNEIVSELVDVASTISKVATSKEAKEAKDAAKEYAKNRYGEFKNASKLGFGSLSRASENLTLIFPCIASKSISISSDMIAAKAIERKAVTMLQMVFAAVQIADPEVKDVYGYLSKFHKNLDPKGFNIDDVIEISNELNNARGAFKDLLAESSTKAIRDREYYTSLMEKAVIEDNLKNTNYFLESNINKNSINRFTVSENKYGESIINEARVNQRGKYLSASEPSDPNDPYDGIVNGGYDTSERREIRRKATEKENEYIMDDIAWNTFGKRKEKDKADIKRESDKQGKLDKDVRDAVIEDEKRKLHDKIQAEKDAKLDPELRAAAISDEKEKNREKDTREYIKMRQDLFKSQVLDSDIKKANELTPSMMMVNFYVNTNDGLESISNAVIGVKAKLYAVDSTDILNRISMKANEANGLIQLIRASTREISFFKDFLLAIDKAKVDAVSYSKRGSSSKLWKVLERRSINNKRKKYSGSSAASPITTLIISQEEVEYMKKNNNIDLMMHSTARKIMDAYNFMCICVIDENMETAKFIFDTGDDNWETYSFNALERENSDNNYKKIINLMTRIR